MKCAEVAFIAEAVAVVAEASVESFAIDSLDVLFAGSRKREQHLPGEIGRNRSGGGIASSDDASVRQLDAVPE